MAVRVWGRTADKKFKFLSLSAKYLPEALSIYRDSFFLHEAVHKVAGIAQSDKASRQVLRFFEVIAQHGVSVVAVEEDTDKVVGAALNRIQVINPEPSDPKPDVCCLLLAVNCFSQAPNFLIVTSALLEVGGQRHAPAALPPGMTRYPLYRRLVRPRAQCGRVQKISPPTGIRSPHRPARIQSLYRLSYPGPQHTNMYHK